MWQEDVRTQMGEVSERVPCWEPGRWLQVGRRGPGLARETVLEWELPAPTRDPVPACSPAAGGQQLFVSEIVRGARGAEPGRAARGWRPSPCSEAEERAAGGCGFPTPSGTHGGAVSCEVGARGRGHGAGLGVSQGRARCP